MNSSVVYAHIHAWFKLFGPRKANLVLIAYVSSEGSGELDGAHLCISYFYPCKLDKSSWAKLQHDKTNKIDLYAQRRLGSAWASAQSDQSSL